MKVTITDRGDGFLVMRLDAESNVEHMIMSVCGNGPIEGASVSLDGQRGRPRVSIGYLSLPALEVVKDAPVKP
jgi:hypothetical protein